MENRRCGERWSNIPHITTRSATIRARTIGPWFLCGRRQEGTWEQCGPQPLGDKPLLDISTDENLGPEYVKLQNALLSLSQNSKQIVAEKSGHFVIIDRPDVVIEAIRQVAQSARDKNQAWRVAPVPSALLAICPKS